MIKINLLGDETVRDNTGVIQLGAYGASIVLFLIICFFLQSSVNNQIVAVKAETQQLEAKLAKLKEKTKEVRELEARKEELGRITLAIATLKKKQEGPVHILDDINKALPEKIWIRDINEKGQTMRIEGMTLTDADLVSFMRLMEQSLYFDRIDLVDSVSVPLMQITTYTSFNGKFTRYVVRGEKDNVTAKLGEIRTEAEKNGLIYSYGSPPPTYSVQESSNATRQNQELRDQKRELSEKADRMKMETGFGRRRPTAGKPTLYAWESLEKVRGKLFTIDTRVRNTPKLKKAEDTIVVPVETPAPTA